jgi:hypothetical protein
MLPGRARRDHEAGREEKQAVGLKVAMLTKKYGRPSFSVSIATFRPVVETSLAYG